MGDNLPPDAACRILERDPGMGYIPDENAIKATPVWLVLNARERNRIIQLLANCVGIMNLDGWHIIIQVQPD